MKALQLTSLFLLIAIGAWGQSGYLPQNGLIGYWPLDGNALDAHTFGHHGVMGGTVPIAGRMNNPESGLYFNGTSTFVTIPATVMSQVTATGSFSVAIWVNSDTVIFDREIINDRTASQYTFRFRIGYGYNGHMPVFNPDSAYFDLNANTGTQKVGAPKPMVEGWTQYVYVFESTGVNQGTIKGYWNGVLFGTRPNSTFFGGSRPVTIGRGLMPAFPSGNRHFSGSIDDVAIWNRALSDSEVNHIYQSCQLIIATQPSNQRIGLGDTAFFRVVSNAPGSQYQWQVNEGNGWVKIQNNATYAGTQTANLNVHATSLSLSGNRYRCVVVDSLHCYAYTLDGALQVQCQSGLSTLPPFISAALGSNETLQWLGGTPATLYSWQADTGSGWVNLTNGGQYSGVQTASMTIHGIGGHNDGDKYRCIASFSGCADTSNVTLFEARCYDLISADPANYTAPVGQAAAFVVTSSIGQQFQWYRNDGFSDSPVSNSPRVSGANSDTLTILALNAGDHLTGFYCVVQGYGCADTSTMATLIIGNNTSTEEVALQKAKVYPVPANEEVIVEVVGLLKAVHAQLFDLRGRKVLSTEVMNGRNTIDVSQLADGQYLLRLGASTFKIAVVH